MRSRKNVPPESGKTGGPRERLIFSVLLVVVTVAQGFMAFSAFQQGFVGLYVQALVGGTFTAVLMVLLLFLSLSWAVFEGAVLFIGYAWLVTSILLVARGEVKAESVLIGSLVMATSAFMWCPPRIAALLAAAGYASLWLPALGKPDVPVLLAIGVVTSQLWYLSTRGRSVQKEKIRSDLLARMAFTDPLTGLLNRRSAMDRLQETLHDAETQPECTALILLDLDHFKRINDRMGHHRGDEVLVAVAGCLSVPDARMRVAARWGGEEFLVLCTDQSRNGAVATADHLLACVRDLDLPGFPRVTMSAGLVTFDEAPTIADLLTLADVRLYEAKDRGRDRVVHQEAVVAPVP